MPRNTDTSLNNRTPVPLYYQLEIILRKKIMSGEMAPESLLPSEDDLAHEYNVSRITIRQALSKLEQDGLVVRQRGRRSFVAQTRTFEPMKLTGFIEDLVTSSLKTGTKVLDYSTVKADKDIAEALKLPEGTSVIRIERIRWVQKRPFIYSMAYLPLEIGGKIRPDELTYKPLLMIVENELHLVPSEATQTIRAVPCDKRIGDLLGMKVGEPLLKTDTQIFATNGSVIEFVLSHYPGNEYSHTVNLRRRQRK